MHTVHITVQKLFPKYRILKAESQNFLDPVLAKHES